MWKKGKATELSSLYSKYFTAVQANIPVKYHERLKRLAEEKKYTVSALVAIALHNEFDSNEPFEFDTGWPDGPFVQFTHAEDANKLYHFLLEWGRRGLTIENIIMCRESYDVEDLPSVKLALRELYMADKVEAFNPSRGMKSLTPTEGERFRLKIETLPRKMIIPTKGPLSE